MLQINLLCIISLYLMLGTMLLIQEVIIELITIVGH